MIFWFLCLSSCSCCSLSAAEFFFSSAKHLLEVHFPFVQTRILLASLLFFFVILADEPLFSYCTIFVLIFVVSRLSAIPHLILYMTLLSVSLPSSGLISPPYTW